MNRIPRPGRLAPLTRIPNRRQYLTPFGGGASGSWLTGYLDGDGVVDLVAANALDSVDVNGAEWAWVAVLGPPASSSMCVGSATNERAMVIPSGSGAIYQYMGGGYGGRAFGLGAPPPDLYGAAVEVHRTGSGLGRARWVKPDGTTAVGEEGYTYATTGLGGAAYIGSGDVTANMPFTGPVYAVVVLRAIPTADEVTRLLAGEAPWVIWDPSDVCRAWSLGNAVDDKGTVSVADEAEANGGPFTATPAVMRNGSIAKIVTL